MSNIYSLLIVDDDEQLVVMLTELLQLEGFRVASAASGPAGMRALSTDDFDLVVLDVMMPGMDGFETLARLRAESSLPVIMLTARGEADDRIRGLERGADDYLAKPFQPRELLLRIRAILKRGGSRDARALIDYSGVELDPGNLCARVNDAPLALTGAELRILEALLREPGAILSRDTLTRFALGRPFTPYDRALDTHVSNLRHKLSDKDAAVEIRSVRGAGYTLVATAAES